VEETKLNEELITEELSYLDEEIEPEVEYCYIVEVIYNDCEDTFFTEEQCITLDEVSIREINAQTFQIFPNPVHGEVNITGSVVPTAVRIYNITGQLAYETTACSAHMNISVTTLPTGVYFIQIDSEHGSITQKLIFK
jgi:hypothetical protein